MSSENKIKIALDCMGGDNSPKSVIHGASIISEKFKDEVKFLFFGDRGIIEHLTSKYSINCEYKIIHTENNIPNEAKPSNALRGVTREYKKSSMVLSIQSVKNNESDLVVSAGNTGALMATSRYILGTLPSIDRPAIVTAIPNELSEQFIMLDLGANIGSTTEDLLQLSLMGAVFGKIILKKSLPRVSLLNIGEEEMKGNDTIKNTYQTLKHLSNNDLFRFCGYIEPHNIFKNLTDVVVCDGFVGNVALKTMEGTASMIKKYLTQGFKSSILGWIGYFLAKNGLKKTMSLIDPRNKNGAMLIGLNGVVIKSHGSADGFAFSYAISVGINLIKNDVNKKIMNEIEKSDLMFEKEE
jgi:glycerol-3-phosphate acyltransferase PlsX